MSNNKKSNIASKVRCGVAAVVVTSGLLIGTAIMSAPSDKPIVEVDRQDDYELVIYVNRKPKTSDGFFVRFDKVSGNITIISEDLPVQYVNYPK